MSWQPPLFPWGGEEIAGRQCCVQWEAFPVSRPRGGRICATAPAFSASGFGFQGAVFMLQLRNFHSVFQMVLEEVPEPMSLDLENLKDPSYSVDDVIVLEVEVKGSVEPFQVLLEPYALIIPGENYIGINVKKDFKMWNNSKSAIRYTWGKISDCHIIEVEPCTGTIEPSEVEDFELSFTGGVPGPTSQNLLCEIKDSPSPVVLHIKAAFKGPALVIDVSALQFGLLRLGQKATSSIQIQNVSQLPATWYLRESRVCLGERQAGVSPFDIEPSSGLVPSLGKCRVNITLEALHCQRLQSVLELEVVNGAWSRVAVTDLYLGVPAKATVTLINGTLLPTRFHWGKLLGLQASSCTVKVSPRRGTLGPSEERQLSLELTTHTQEELTDLALPCNVSGMKEPLVLGISGKPQGLQVAIAISTEDPDSSTELQPGHPEKLLLDFGSTVPLRTCVNRWLTLTNCSPIQTPFTLTFEYFGSPPNSLSQKPSLWACWGGGLLIDQAVLGPVVGGELPPNMPPVLLKTARMRELLAKREQLEFMESMLSHGKGASFFPHISQGVLGAHQQLGINITACANMWGEYWDNLICMVGDLPPTVIPVHMAVVGCPISSLRTTFYTTDQFQKEPVIRFGTQVSGGDTVTRILRLNNSSPCDIRLDWETYAPEDREDRLLELLVFYGPPFPLRDQAGNDLLCPETPESSSSWSPSPSDTSDSSHKAAQSAEGSSSGSVPQKVISVILQGHEGVPSDHLFSISPKQVVVPAGGSSTIHISFTPVVLGPEVLHKVECTGYALGFMSLDDEVERELPGRRRRLQDFAVGPMRLDLHSYVRPAQLSVELDYCGSMAFRHQASDLIPEQPCSGSKSPPAPTRAMGSSGQRCILGPPTSAAAQVLSELVTTHHLKLTNTTDIPHYFRLLVSKPFSVSQDGASRSRRPPGPGWKQECEEETEAAGPQLVLFPQENMLVSERFCDQWAEVTFPPLTRTCVFRQRTSTAPTQVNVSFSLSLELLSYQKLPADQMLPGVAIQQSASGEKEMVFTQNLLLEYSNQTTQVVPLRAIVAVPELQLSTSWVDFGTCFVNQARVREVYLMNLSGCRSYWTVLTGQQEPDKDPVAFRVSPCSGLLEARAVHAPPTSITLKLSFTARSCELYESTLMVEGVLGESSCTLRLRGQGSYDERYASPCQF
ncbi:Deleted in lung and esophageal cancer protein 1 [Camelus dromedarius]|uniref:Deleted in lung and esophageal cancer protein 1 n=1 Tax=Camelus dromedarius TaxID=9838 RepID=A0A5N4D0G2_CAMDR|nr:Deleted in lung and esophageal cancer protein 1 [Camelus dromedarius]